MTTARAVRLLARAEAAAYLGVSLRTFQDHVQPDLAGAIVWIDIRRPEGA